MRTTYFIYLLMAILVSGCDPTGLRRVEVQLYPANVQVSSITVGAPDVQEALQIIDAVVLRHDFHLVSQSGEGYVRIYSFSLPPVMVGDQSYARSIPCRVRLTPVGLEVTFDYYGFLAANPQAEDLFEDVRKILIKRYGKQNIKSYKSGVA